MLCEHKPNSCWLLLCATYLLVADLSACACSNMPKLTTLNLAGNDKLCGKLPANAGGGSHAACAPLPMRALAPACTTSLLASSVAAVCLQLAAQVHASAA